MESKTLHTLFRLVVAWTLVPSGILLTGAGQLQKPERDLHAHRTEDNDDSQDRVEQYRRGSLIAPCLAAGIQSHIWKLLIEVPCLRQSQMGYSGADEMGLYGGSSALSRLYDALSTTIAHWLQENSGRSFWAIAFDFASLCDE
jgi:hypothetical protein